MSQQNAFYGDTIFKHNLLKVLLILKDLTFHSIFARKLNTNLKVRLLE